MRLSTTTAIYRDRPDGKYIPIIESIKRCAKAGYKFVDINFCHAIHFGIEINENDWEAWIDEVKEVLDKYGVKATQSHAPFYNVIDYSISERDFYEEMVRRSIIASGRLGVEWVVMHAGSAFDDNNFIEVSKKRNIEYFKPHIELAGKYNTGIAIENMADPFTQNKIRNRRRYTAGIEELVDLVDTINQDNVGICWDFGHANLMSVDQSKCIKYIGNRLKATHVADNKGLYDDHLLPYCGTVKWDEVMYSLKEINYCGDFAYETHRFTDKLPEELIDDALTYSIKIGEYLLGL